VTDAVVAAANDKPLGILSPNSWLPWQYVLEPLSGYLLLGQLMFEDKNTVAEALNFGPSLSTNLTTKNLIDLMGVEWSKVVGEFAVDPGGRHEAGLLMQDSTKARTYLG
jgi:CDP-glucose 4,6-dehydratase